MAERTAIKAVGDLFGFLSVCVFKAAIRYTNLAVMNPSLKREFSNASSLIRSNGMSPSDVDEGDGAAGAALVRALLPLSSPSSSSSSSSMRRMASFLELPWQRTHGHDGGGEGDGDGGESKGEAGSDLGDGEECTDDDDEWKWLSEPYACSWRTWRAMRATTILKFRCC
jgi:hypothetical protein